MTTAPPVPPDPRLTLGPLRPRELRAMLAERLRLLALLRHAGSGALLGLAGLTLGSALAMPALALLTAEVVDRAAQGAEVVALLPYLAALGLALLVQQARPLVDALPNGLDSQLGTVFEGADLSHGQWQKLALARGLLCAHPRSCSYSTSPPPPSTPRPSTSCSSSSSPTPAKPPASAVRSPSWSHTASRPST
ncbi:ABC transporter ATP-binding protein/permease [Streptomyces jeddahensis]|nr:ABC transporter ATP-binding protein/permease [Streptomyces jeddahensis]